MDKKLIYKMIENCFKQYYETLPINEIDLEFLYNRVIKIKGEEPNVELYEVINDAVYEYLTD